MVDRKRVLRVLGVLVIAGGTGHIMQYGGAVSALGTHDSPLPTPVAPLTQVVLPPMPHLGDARGLSLLPGLGDERPLGLTPKRLDDPQLVRLAALDTRNDASPEPLAAPQSAPTCDAQLEAVTEPAALVRLTLTAPCHPESRVELRHEVLEIVAYTDAAGRMELVVPALAISAEFTALLDGLPPAAAVAEVAALADYHRVAISWAGVGDLELHAFEDGASYGEDGHVWHGAPRSAAHAERGDGGFVLRLGHMADPVPVMADVYSVPISQAGNVRLTVESLVDSSTCGLDLAGHGVQVTQGTMAQLVEIVLAMPNCGQQEGYLVLDDVFPEVETAAR